MNWLFLTEEQQLKTIKEQSAHQNVVIFKHSTRCSISAMAKSRLERSNAPENIVFYCLDLLQYRQISNFVAREFDVMHQSPQVLVIKNGACIFDESHNGITMEEIVEVAAVA